ncbi:glutathione transferase GST 23-like [Nicotiana tabacum]|uniref:Probable glutathione S-transferase n=2 Tax=Nicotiana TaxID=4085 RepID=A0A1S3YMK4_TOBAC|nr:PREDICTED: glutathione transferase GST 23-like [Nicotiana sylvestris]XP_016453165.1 PREDICTED: glutathione transferase GST 23-like [Nicotiana tabacum]
MAEELKLHRTWSSPFGLRAVWALHIKGIQYDTIYEDLSQKSPELLQHNPVHKKIPVLVHKGKPICESLVILEYIDETWKEAPLLPQDPYEKATVRFWAKFGEEKLLPSIWSVFTGQGNEKNEALGPAVQNLELFEEQLKEKKFFGGEEIGYLDLSLGWLAYLLDVFEEVIDLKLFDAAKLPLLSAWMNNFYDAPVIKEHWPPRDKLVTKFQLLHENYQKAFAAK